MLPVYQTPFPPSSTSSKEGHFYPELAISPTHLVIVLLRMYSYVLCMYAELLCVFLSFT